MRCPSNPLPLRLGYGTADCLRLNWRFECYGDFVNTECLFFESTRTILDTIGIQLSLRQFLDFSMREGRSAFELAIERVGKTTGRGVERERDLLYSEMLRKQTRVLPDVSES